MGEHEPRKMNEGVCLCQARCRAVGWKLRAVIHVHKCSPRLSPSGRGELRPGGRERGPQAQSQKPDPHASLRPDKVGAASLVGP